MGLRLLSLCLVLLASSASLAMPPETTPFTLPTNATVAAAWKQLDARFPQVLEDRAGLRASTQALPPGNFTFWELVDQLARRSDVVVRVQPTEGKIVFLSGEPSRAPMAAVGPFRLTLRRVGNSLDLENRNVGASATLEVAWEPQIQPYYLETRPQQLRIQTGLGKNVPGLAEGTATVPVDGRIGLTFDFRLPAVARAEQTLSSVEGKLTAIVPTRMVPIALPPLADLEAAPNADAAILAFPRTGPAGRITRIVRTRDRWSIQVQVQGPPGADLFESYQSWVIQNEATLRTLEGKVWKSSGYFLEANTASRAVVTYHFLVRECPEKPDPATWRFQYTTPAAIVNTEIPFRFVDVPLP